MTTGRRCSVMLLSMAVLAAWAPMGALAGYREFPTVLKLADLVPGTERVTLLPNGDFEDGDALWQAKTGWGKCSIGAPVIPVMPAVCGSKVLRTHAGQKCGWDSSVIQFEPDTEYVFSGYVWLLGDDQTAPGSATMALPQAQHAFLGWPAPGTNGRGLNDGAYFYCRFTPTPSQIKSGSVVDCKTGGTDQPDKRFGFTDASGKFIPVSILWDNVAVTKAGEFRPPMQKQVAIDELLALITKDLSAGVDERDGQASPASRAKREALAACSSARPDFAAAATLLAKAVEADANDPGARNMLSAAMLIQFIQQQSEYLDTNLWDDKARAALDKKAKPDDGLVRKAVEQFDASLKVNPDQPQIRRLADLWREVSNPRRNRMHPAPSAQQAQAAASAATRQPTEEDSPPPRPKKARGKE